MAGNVNTARQTGHRRRPISNAHKPYGPVIDFTTSRTSMAARPVCSVGRMTHMERFAE